MKIAIENYTGKQPELNGKGKFAYRLALELMRQGHDVNCQKPDVAIRFNALPETDAPVKIVRIDNAAYCYEAMQAKTNANKRLTHAIEKGDGVVFQSRMSWHNVVSVLKAVPKTATVIPNGVEGKSISRDTVKREAIIACQHVHPMRRIQQCVDLWPMIRSQCIDAKLRILWDRNTGCDMNTWEPFLEHAVLQDKLNEILKMASCVLLMTYGDSCPNLGAESLSVGCPVVCCGSSGITEFSNQSNGLYVVKDAPPPARMQDWSEPPEFDSIDFVLKVAEMLKYPRKAFLPDALNIKTIAKQYISFAKKVIHDTQKRNN